MPMMMENADLRHTEDIQGSRIKSFQHLMRFRVRDILLVSSLYDNYLFEEDGRLYELVHQEAMALNLSFVPEFTHASTAAEALELMRDGRAFDLIISTMHIEDMHVVKFAQAVRAAGYDIPIILLAYDNQERKEIVTQYDTSIFERIFIWLGDYRLLIAIIKDIEDRRNVEEDTRMAGVQVIILVEDNVKFYSSYLPILYSEVLNQSQRLIREGVNISHRLLRMRARPKILLCHTYDEAWAAFQTYREHVLGIVSDVNYVRNGVKDPEAGLLFARKVRELQDDIPVLLQSSNTDFEASAHECGAAFLRKGDPRLLHELRAFVLNNFGFGDFQFRMADGTEVGRAVDLTTLEEGLMSVPEESIVFHANRNHFSKWLKARTEFGLAYRLRPQKVDDYPTPEALRQSLIGDLRRYREMRQRGVILEFSAESFDPKNTLARMGGGSLGGKARGLGFVNSLINNYGLRHRFPGVVISVPSAVIIATDVFDEFLEKNHLEAFALSGPDDKELRDRFLEAPHFSHEVVRKLWDYLDIVKEPLAIRSSSLLEDAQYQPFAGVYETYMIPNNNPDKHLRMQELIESIKLVYASTFARQARDYMKATAYRLEEEKMAVIIQCVVGERHNGRFYPDFAGVAKSYNFYPVPPQSATDGIVQVALGLGKTVVDGGNVVRFCPKHPRHLMQFYSTNETIKHAQQQFYALDLEADLRDGAAHAPETFICRYDLASSEADGTLYAVGSTWSPENEAVYDGISRPGKRVVTFAPVLKHQIFPLPEIVDLMLEMGTWGMGTPVEIEFAATLTGLDGRLQEFAMLQIRPMVLHRELDELEIGTYEEADVVCSSERVLGNGMINDIYDAIVVDIESFDREQSKLVASEVAELNAVLLSQKRPYILIGVGRWGSLDHWLGIPVSWDQIAGASVIVESAFRDFNVTPSQGSHFFQNITSFRVGYFTVNPFEHLGRVNWDWLRSQPAVRELSMARHLCFDRPLIAKINGHKNRGVILKPGVT
ncbi:MAG: histidine kinase [Bacteroidetes bacterium]|jgi:CheY-like chemotaxis protein|nr:histidine kinase [Bacteroidota bacterium]